jgi:hypothetical protein
MTKVTIAQGMKNGPAVGAQSPDVVLDSVVPPVIPLRRMAVVFVVIVGLAALGWLGRQGGGYTPGLAFTGNPNWGGPQVHLSGNLQSTRLLPVTVTGIDASAPGLVGPRVSFATPSGGRLRLPLRLHEGQVVAVAISWRHVDCAQIRLDESYFMPVTFTDVAGLRGTVALAPLWWVRPYQPPTVVHPLDPHAVEPPTVAPLGVGWPAGVSWVACGRSPATAPLPRPATTG